jgi:hypothetical protein
LIELVNPRAIMIGIKLPTFCIGCGPQTSNSFVRISLGVNIFVLIAVCTVLIAFSTSEPVIYSWGPPTPGRGILLSIYFSILVVSMVLLVLHTHSNASSNYNNKAAVEHMIAALLAAQVLYKITTPATAGAAWLHASTSSGVAVFARSSCATPSAAAAG